MKKLFFLFFTLVWISSYAQTYTYSASPSIGTYVSCPLACSSWLGSVVQMKAKTIDGSNFTFTIKKCDGSAFTTNGTIYIGWDTDMGCSGNPPTTYSTSASITAGSYSKDITVSSSWFSNGSHSYWAGAYYSGTNTYYAGMVTATRTLAAPPTPTGLSATAQSSSSIYLSWNSSSGATSYDVYDCSGSSITNTTNTHYTISGLSENTSYSYKVRAVNSGGNSSFTSCQSATTLLNPTKIIGLAGSLNFGNVTIGQTPTATMTISNTGNTALNVTSVSCPSGFSGSWSGSISAGNSQNVTITFSPSSVTTYSGSITVSSDATSGANTISCSGTGTAVPTKIINLSGSLNFGSVTIGQTPTATMTISNTGNTALNVTSVSCPSGFSGSWSGSISAGNSQNVTITFSPSSVTTYSGSITVSSDATSGANTISCSGTGIALPTITTATISNIAQNTATGGGNVTSDGGASVTAKGVCWSTSQNPTASNSHTTDGTGSGSFSSSITSLTANTIYYVRAYATNSAGTAYGSQVSFTSLQNATIPTVTTATISNIAQTTATGGGNVTSDGGASVTAKGVCWSTSQNPTISNSHTTDGSGTGAFISDITGLTLYTTYYVRAYATNSAGTAYGSQVSFTSLQSISIPTVTTTAISNIAQTIATSGGIVTSDGGSAVTTKGICWSTSQNPTTSNSYTADGTGTGAFSSSIVGLTANTIYYVRAYATNSAGTAYGSQVNFTTLPNATIPTVTTATISNIAQTTATSGGNVTSDGGASVTAKGVCWSTSQNPTTSNSHTTDGIGTGSFSSSITGLTANTNYYVRAYATNSAGTAYGSQVNFTTLPNATTPTVTATTISNITQTTATSGGNVTSDGGASVTAKGVCWSTSQNPTTSNSHTTDGIGTGSFSSIITGLTANTIYYIRAYATNSAGTAYSSQISFTTLQNLFVPIVTTSTISNIAQTTATGGGNVTSDGGAAVNAKGICWSTSQNPTTSNIHTTDGTGMGSFSSDITGLTANTMYYIRAYASNSVGTSYGSQMILTTLQGISVPTVTTAPIINITQTTATGGGNVTNDGNASVTTRGICWSTSQNPTTSNSHTTNGTGTGMFTSSLAGLTSGTLYFIRAYATNIAGTAYGYEQSFTTTNPTPVPNIVVTPTSMTFFEGDGSKSGNNINTLPYKVTNKDLSQDLNNGGQATRVIIPKVVTDNWRNKMLNKYDLEKTTSLYWTSYDTPVRNQGSCGSCWAFAAIGLLENIANQAGLGQQDLSEQVVVSCVPSNCNGGWPKKAFNYVKDNGIIPENCFPYTHTNNVCGNECSNPSDIFKITNYEPSLWGTNPTVADLKTALQQGPLTVTFKVYSGFNSYNGGIYNYQSGNYSGNHAVLLVGYNDNQQYFKVKNSWGANWGENGYFRIAYDDVTDDPKFGSNASYAEGIYLVGSSPPSAGMFTITNTGNAVLIISNIAVNKTWLDINPQTVSPLAPGASIDIIATLSDWNALTASDIATITITSNDPDEPISEVNITAEKLSGASTPELLVSTEFYQDAELPNTNSSFTIDVDAIKEDSAVVNWNAHTNDTWLTITDTSGVNAGVVIVNYNANNTGSSRIGYISITSADVSNSPQIISVIQGINQAPVISDVTKIISNLSDSVNFSAIDFINQFTDADGNTLQFIRIVSPPDSGTLKLNNEPIVAYQTIFLNDISNLVFVPNTSWNGNSSFEYNASDGMNFSGSNANVNISYTTNVNAEISESIFIYPNPVTNNLQIQTALQIKNIEITDITGRLLYRTTSKSIDCSGLAKGVYFIKVTTEKGIAVKKFIKE